MDEPQPKQKRIRKRSTAMQLQIALQAVETLDKEPMNDWTAARMNLAKIRLVTLNKMVLRERNHKLKALQAEVERLTAENAKLKAEIAAKSAPRPLTDIEQALAKYERERRTDDSRI